MRRTLLGSVLIALLLGGGATAAHAASPTVTITPTVTSYPAGGPLPPSLTGDPSSLASLAMILGPGVALGTTPTSVSSTATVPTGMTFLDVQATTTTTGSTSQAVIDCPSGTGWWYGANVSLDNYGAILPPEGQSAMTMRIWPTTPAGTYETVVVCVPILDVTSTVLPKNAKTPVAIGTNQGEVAQFKKGQKVTGGWRLVKEVISDIPSGSAALVPLNCPGQLMADAYGLVPNVDLSVWGTGQGKQAMGTARMIGTNPSAATTTSYVVCGSASTVTGG